METYIVGDQEADERLDRFLARRFAHVSRSQLQKWIHDAHVTVNDTVVSKHHFLRAGETVYVQTSNEPATPKQPTAALHSHIDIPILYEDDDMLVINKPIGILTHPADGKEEYTAVDFVRAHVPGIGVVGENPNRPGIVHRLDRDVSGALIIAKTPKAYQQLKQQFHDRRVEKEYRAIVHGIPNQDSDVIRFRIARSKTHSGKMAARPEQGEGRDAWTAYDVLQRIHNRYAYVSIHIRTGRTHQIRAHLSAIDHPVVGDTLYTSRRYDKKQYPRLFLHAYRLVVLHPRTGQPVSVEAPLPKAFEEFSHTPLQAQTQQT